MVRQELQQVLLQSFYTNLEQMQQKISHHFLASHIYTLCQGETYNLFFTKLIITFASFDLLFYIEYPQEVLIAIVRDDANFFYHPAPCCHGSFVPTTRNRRVHPEQLSLEQTSLYPWVGHSLAVILHYRYLDVHE